VDKNITVHRSTIRKDIIEIFSDENILNFYLNADVIDTHGRKEKGKGRGVMLDVLTNFWNDCFTALTVGSKEKTPYIRHDHQKKEWEAIARVLVYGYKKLQYFTLKLSQLFIASCLFGEESITPEFLLESFREYIASEDKEILDSCMSDAFDPNDDDTMEFLSSFKCFKVHTKENIKAIITELAHQELLQKPRYVLKCWAPIVYLLRTDDCFQTLEGLKHLYQAKQPTAKKIVKLFKAFPCNDGERQSLDFLKRFVKSLEGAALAVFLHFCTGSDVITCDDIEISFTLLDGMQRRPIARTCIPLIEIPAAYESYPALAEEFTNILKDEQAWSFDIV
jgi:hypothetical protein